MPLLTKALIPVGRIAGSNQPHLIIDDRLTLRPWRDDDAAAVAAVYQDHETQQWHARTLDGHQEALDLLTGWRRGWADETGFSWAVADDQDNAIGRVALGSVNLHEGGACVAYWTAPKARGRGVAPLAVHAVARWAFDVAGFHRLHLDHSTQNHASCRVALKAGFEPEGTRRSAALHPDGWHDMHVHALIEAPR